MDGQVQSLAFRASCTYVWAQRFQNANNKKHGHPRDDLARWVATRIIQSERGRHTFTRLQRQNFHHNHTTIWYKSKNERRQAEQTPEGALISRRCVESDRGMA